MYSLVVNLREAVKDGWQGLEVEIMEVANNWWAGFRCQPLRTEKG